MRGIDVFRTYFQDYSDQYVVIGGAACELVLGKYAESFRATKDIDMVLFVEALTPAFGERFWKFIEDGEYSMRMRSSGRPEFFRFQKPRKRNYPEMIELFSQTDSDAFSSPSRYTQIHIDDDISSLSAILLDKEYYQLLNKGKVQIEGVAVLDATHLIPFKAKAFLDLSMRREAGEEIDSRKIRKHKNDIVRLVSILNPSSRCQLPSTIHADMRYFTDGLLQDEVSAEVVDILKMVYISDG